MPAVEVAIKLSDHEGMPMSGKSAVVRSTDLKGLGPKREGKVRDIYDLGEVLLLVATDRLSAFDVVLPDGIPWKGFVLTQLSRFWFKRLGMAETPVPHHFIADSVEAFPPACLPHRELLAGRSLLVEKTDPLPVECIVRGYLSGSAWKEYREKGTVCGLPLPRGLVESSRLPEPIFTPSTKAQEGHDQNIPIGEMNRILGDELSMTVRETSLAVYRWAAAYAIQRGIIIADTKLEFGRSLKTGKLLLIDEVLTPDSSRFWPAGAYSPGGPQPSFDKQFVRDYLDSIVWDRKPPAPRLPPSVIEQTSEKYLEALARLTGTGFPE